MIALPPVPVLAARLQRNPDPETFVLLQAARRREGRREAAARVKRARRAARARFAAERARQQAEAAERTDRPARRAA